MLLDHEQRWAKGVSGAGMDGVKVLQTAEAARIRKDVLLHEKDRIMWGVRDIFWCDHCVNESIIPREIKGKDNDVCIKNSLG